MDDCFEELGTTEDTEDEYRRDSSFGPEGWGVYEGPAGAGPDAVDDGRTVVRPGSPTQRPRISIVCAEPTLKVTSSNWHSAEGFRRSY